MSLKIKYNNYPSIGGLIKQLNKTVEDNIKLLRVFQDEITPAPICKIEILLEKLEQNIKKYPVEKAKGRNTKYDKL